MTTKLLTGIAVAVCVTLGIGWLWGASGKSSVELARQGLEERLDLSEARRAILDGRVSLFLVNFGDASRHFDEARGFIEHAQLRWRETGQAERAGRLEVVLAHARDAQRLAAALDAGAQNAADAALQALTAIEKQ
jgi:hypothetical protein